MFHEFQEPHPVEPDAGDSAPHRALEPEANTDPRAMSLLIIDDVEAQGVLLKGILQRAGYRHVHYLREPLEVAAYAQQNPPDLVLLDLVMPHMSGFQVMAVLQELFPDGYLPILMLTSDDRREVRQKALELGATDFLPKPFDAAEVSLRVANLLKTRGLYAQLQEQNRTLEAKIEERTRLLETSHMEMLTRLARAAEYRDEESKEHIWRVARTAELTARELGLPGEQADVLLRAARLHDVGKIRRARGHFIQTRQAHRRRIRSGQGAHHGGRAAPVGRSVGDSQNGGNDRAHAPRTLGRLRLSAGSQGYGHPHRRPHHGGGGHLRRLDPRPHPPPRLVGSRGRDRNQFCKAARRSTRGWSRLF